VADPPGPEHQKILTKTHLYLHFYLTHAFHIINMWNFFKSHYRFKYPRTLTTRSDGCALPGDLDPQRWSLCCGITGLFSLLMSAPPRGKTTTPSLLCDKLRKMYFTKYISIHHLQQIFLPSFNIDWIMLKFYLLYKVSNIVISLKYWGVSYLVNCSWKRFQGCWNTYFKVKEII